MKLRSFLIFLIFLSTVLVGCSSNQAPVEGLSMEQRLEDFEYLYELIVNNYPLLKVNERQNGINWAQEKEEFEEWIRNTTTDQHFQTVISNIMRRLNNGHTQVVDRGNLLRIHRIYSDPKAADIFKKWTEIIEADHVLKWYGIEEQELNTNTSTQNSTARHSNSPRFRTSIIIPDEVAYFKIDNFWWAGIEEFQNDVEDMRKFFTEVSNYDKLIIDIRGNPGGHDLYWMYGIVPPLINESVSVDNYFFVRGPHARQLNESRGINLFPINQLENSVLGKLPLDVREDFQYYGIRNVSISPTGIANELDLTPLEPVGFNGEIFMLMDEKVFSSADGFASFAKDTGFATLIGVPTMGDIGEPLLASLPNSGIVIRFSGILPINGDGTINAEVGTTPHIEMPNHSRRIGSWDEAIQYVIDLND